MFWHIVVRMHIIAVPVTSAALTGELGLLISKNFKNALNSHNI